MEAIAFWASVTWDQPRAFTAETQFSGRVFCALRGTVNVVRFRKSRLASIAQTPSTRDGSSEFCDQGQCRHEKCG